MDRSSWGDSDSDDDPRKPRGRGGLGYGGKRVNKAAAPKRAPGERLPPIRFVPASRPPPSKTAPVVTPPPTVTTEQKSSTSAEVNVPKSESPKESTPDVSTPPSTSVETPVPVPKKPIGSVLAFRPNILRKPGSGKIAVVRPITPVVKVETTDEVDVKDKVEDKVEETKPDVRPTSIDSTHNLSPESPQTPIVPPTTQTSTPPTNLPPSEEESAAALKNLGLWEKHTRGIGAKLLTKYGFRGQLGAREDGVSAVADVLVRSGTSGLGFNDAGSLLTVEETARKAAAAVGVQLTAIPLTEAQSRTGKKGRGKKRSREESWEEQLAATSASSWKKSSTTGSSTKKRVDEFSEVLQRMFADENKSTLVSGVTAGKKLTILDMRHAVTRVVTDMSTLDDMESDSDRSDDDKPQAITGTVPSRKSEIGKALLRNLSAIVELETEKMKQEARRIANCSHQSEELAREIKELEQQVNFELTKKKRLENWRTRLLSLEKALNSGPSEESLDDESLLSCIVNQIALVRTEIIQLCEEFSQECTAFGLSNSLPNILQRLLEPLNWQNLMIPNSHETEEDTIHRFDKLSTSISAIAEAWQTVVRSLEKIGLRSMAAETESALSLLIRTTLLPLLHRLLSVSWNPLGAQNLSVVRFFGALRLTIADEEIASLIEVVLVPVWDKTLQMWNPSQNKNSPIIRSLQSPQSWLLPWLTIASRQVASFFPEIRRRLAQFFRTNWNVDDVEEGMSQLRPWRDVFDSKAFEELCTRHVAPRLVSTLRRREIPSAVSSTTVSEESTGNALDMFRYVILPWKEVFNKSIMDSLLVGEFLPRWLSSVLDSSLGCRSGYITPTKLTEWFSPWLHLFTTHDLLSINTFSAGLHLSLSILTIGDLSSQIIMTEDDARRLIQQVEQFDFFVLSRQYNFESTTQQNFNTLHQQKSSASILGAAYSAATALTTSLRELLEKRAEDLGIEFVPRFGSSVSGKPIWQLGSQLIFIESDVLYAQKNSHSKTNVQSTTDNASLVELEWEPIGLEALLQRATS